MIMKGAIANNSSINIRNDKNGMSAKTPIIAPVNKHIIVIILNKGFFVILYLPFSHDIVQLQ